MADNGTTTQDTTSQYMLFSYWIFIVIFLGFVGNFFALVIFNKPFFKSRSAHKCYRSLGLSAILSSFGFILSYINMVEDDEQAEHEQICRFAVFLEVLGHVTYASLMMIMVCYSTLKTFCFVKQLPIIQRQASKQSTIVQWCVWSSGVVLGVLPAWVLGDTVLSKHRQSCSLQWSGQDGEVAWYPFMFTIGWTHVPALISLIAINITRRIQKKLSMTSVCIAAQSRVNSLHHNLAIFFFVATIPYHTVALSIAGVNPSFMNSKTLLVCKLFSHSHVVFGPFIFLSKSRSYRGYVGRILTCSTSSPVAPVNSNSMTMTLTRLKSLRTPR